MLPFTERLRSALVPGARAGFVYVANVEVERQWAHGATGLPKMSFDASDAVVNRMDELALTMAGAGDQVVLKTPPDPEYLEYLSGLGFALPGIIAVGGQDPRRMVTEDALADPATLDRLAALSGAYLLPHGVSPLEETLSARTGIPLAAPDAKVCRAVNSKVYSRRITDELGIRQPAGWACDGEETLAGAIKGARELVEAGRRVVLKDAFGVSGKGMVVVTEPRRLDRMHKMVATQAARHSDAELALVVEEWVDKDYDLNYQFTVGADGEVNFDFIKRAITEQGVHKGHRMPAGLDAAQHEEVLRCAQLLGARLAADGYRGVVGVDAMVDPHGRLYPVTEINARLNMSTYQTTLTERFLGPGMIALARHYPLRLAEPIPFGQLRTALGSALARPGGTGLVVNAFATVNAAAGDGPFSGRLYGVLVADSTERLDALDAQVEDALEGAQHAE